MKNFMRPIKRTATKQHECACGCGKWIGVGDRMYEVTYVLKGGHWYTEYYHYNHW